VSLRRLAAVAALAVVVSLGLGLAARTGLAQRPTRAPVPSAPGIAPGAPGAPARIIRVPDAVQERVDDAVTQVAGHFLPNNDPPERDVDQSSGTAMALLFWAFALGVVGGAVFVITRRNLIAAVMGMVATFFALAGLYMMLYASFLAIIQMLVYAGAIMVLFVFVIMVLNKPEDEPWGMVGLPGKVLAGLAMLYLLARLVFLLWAVKPADEKLALEAPQAIPATVVEPTGDVNPQTGQPLMLSHTENDAFGSTSAVGSSLFGDYLFPFEAISILLLIAVVGAIAVARPLKDDDAPAGGAP
jgi:NADH-quinone oxidoreductase subunit J